MKNNTRSMKAVFALLAASAALCVSAWAQPSDIVYDNTSTNSFTGQQYGSTSEFGDQITLAGQSFDRTITAFRFDYYLSHGVSGNEQATLTVYDTTGPSGGPGNVLFSDGPFNISSGYNTVTDSGLNVSVPDSIIWTVKFSGISADETVGLLFYNPPTVGSSLDDYWEKVNGVWTLNRFSPSGGPIANFGAQVLAIPEPSTVQYALLAGLAALGVMAYRRQTAKVC
jgi:hypothetical protein